MSGSGLYVMRNPKTGKVHGSWSAPGTHGETYCGVRTINLQRVETVHDDERCLTCYPRRTS